MSSCSDKLIRQFCNSSQFSAKKFLSSINESAVGMVSLHQKMDELNSVFGSMIR